MNKVKILYCIFFCVFILTNSCNKESYLNSPNSPSLDNIDADLYLNRVQLTLPSFIDEIARIGAHLVRAEAMPATLYSQFETPESLNDVWINAYRTILINIKNGEELALKNKMYTHYAIMETIKAYTLMSLVDYFGDIPYTEALDVNNLNPKLDKGATVYQAALDALNSALYNFTLTPSVEPTNDLYYGGTKENWVKLINSLKLKYFVQIRLVTPASKDSINALLLLKKFISIPAEDFQFRYGKNISLPDSRNPTYVDCYTSKGVGNGSIPAFSNYLGTYGMNRLRSGGTDPRWRFLLYRQANVATATTDDLPCSGGSGPSFYTAADFFCNDGVFWGRNHGDASGIPPDGLKRTTWGLYPVGGAFDASKLSSVSKTPGALGAGVLPMMTSSMVKLYRAEAALKLLTSDAGTEATLLVGAMTDFSNKLLDFGKAINFTETIDTSSVLFKPSGYKVAMVGYQTTISTNFASATDANAKLKIIVAELYKCSWGNGMEVYNTYRRTGYPDDLQPSLTLNPGPFPRSMFYPQEAVLYNKNIQQKPDLTIRVFWDDGTSVLK